MAAPVVIEDWVDRDLSEEVRSGGLTPAFEVDDLVAQAEEVLRAAGKRSVVLVGPLGVGKTAVIHALVQRAHDGVGVDALAKHRVVQISLRGVSARFKEKSEGAKLFDKLCGALSKAAVIPFIRDVHLAYSLDWEPVLHRFLVSSPLPILAEAQPRELEQLLEYWSDLASFLIPIPVEEPTIPRVRTMVSEWSAWGHARGAPAIGPAAQRIAIELTARFMGDRPNPRKSLELLRQTLDFHGADKADQPIGVQEVVHRFSQMTRVPTRLVDPDEHLDLAEVREFVSERLLGQEEAVDAVVRMIALIKAGLADLRRPFGAFLFVGPTGVGKTHCAQLLAEYLFGDRNRLIRINMADHASENDADKLFGNPYASNVKDQRGLITTRLAGHPFGVLLLDEFEKAHAKIHDALLQLIDEGRFINGRSETVSVTSLIVIATSNAGAEVYRKSGLGFDLGRDLLELDRELDRRLHRTFRFELLNRFDRVVHFHPLSRAHIRAIARRELSDLSKRDGLVSREIQIEVDAEVLDWLVAHGYHPHYGARFLRREIERNVAAELAEFLVREQAPRGSRVGLTVRRERIEARRIGPASEKQSLTLPHGSGTRAVKLDRPALENEARAWLQRWEALQAESDERQALASRLIDASAERGFWDDAERAQDVLRRYKSLDARLMADRRMLRPVRRLANVLDRPEDTTTEVLAATVQEVAGNYRRWLDIGVSEQPSAVWLVLSAPDPIAGSAEWLVDLVAMYRGWLRRQGYAYEMVAEEVRSGEVQRIVIEVEGAGVATVLGMEQGEHRRRQGNRVERALVETLTRREGPAGDESDHGTLVEDARRTRGVAVQRRTARLKINLPRRGLKLTLHGSNRETLKLLARDLGPALASPPTLHEPARTYGVVGGSVRDPRTGASTANLKDVMRGNLEVFLRAWLAR